MTSFSSTHLVNFCFENGAPRSSGEDDVLRKSLEESNTMLLTSVNDKNSELRLLNGELRLLRKQQAETRAKLSAQSLEVGRL